MTQPKIQGGCHSSHRLWWISYAVFWVLSCHTAAPSDLQPAVSVSVVVFVVMTWMLLANLTEYALPPRTSHISVYVSKNPHLLTRFDFTLPGLGCDDFGLDFIDVSGELALEVSTDIQKEALGPTSCRIRGIHVINKVSGEFHIAFGRKAEAIEEQQAQQRSRIP